MYKLAKHIHSKESIEYTHLDLFTIKMSALLHDIDDWKFKETESTNKVESYLNQLEGIDQEKKNKITFIIDNVSFKGNQ